jgi:carbamoyl-phosphate synthase small subunit
MESQPVTLALEDGTLFEGRAFGAVGTTVGELVFTTTMTGYQEVLTDPSYAGQIVVMTAPEMGNTGVNLEDAESTSSRPALAGFVVRDASPITSNWRSDESLSAYLAKHGIVSMTEVDTRRLARHIRDRGAQNAALGSESPDVLLDRARKAPNMNGRDLVREVTPREPYPWTEGRGDWSAPWSKERKRSQHRQPPHVVVYDYGIKRNILRCLVDIGFRVTAVPASTSAAAALALEPDGIFLSNGPGDPAAVPYAAETVKGLLGKKPIFGICLGHQILALALGAKTYKLKFGHRGANQPVKDLATGRIEITTQNHGFCVDLSTLPSGAHSTHVHLNDGTSEGLSIESARAFSVQYHPEAAAGPHDSLYLFERFYDAVVA